MKMKIFALLLSVIMITSLFGCSDPVAGENAAETKNTEGEKIAEVTPTIEAVEEKAYTVLMEEEKQYIELNRELVRGFISNELMSSSYIEYPSFPSLAEMKQSIKSGNLSEKTLEAIYRGNGRNTKIEIFNLEELYDVSLPGDIEYESVLWCGKYYEFQMVRNGQPSSIVLGDEESYDYAFRTAYEDHFDTEQTVIVEGTVEDRNATMLHHQNSTGEYKRLHYQLGSGDDVIYVTEHYTIERYDDIPAYRISDTIPDIVYVFGSVDGIPWLRDWMKDPVWNGLRKSGLKKVSKKRCRLS